MYRVIQPLPALAGRQVHRDDPIRPVEGRTLNQHDAEAANLALARLRSLISDLLDVGRLE